MGQTTTAKVRLEAGKAARVSASAQSTDWFDSCCAGGSRFTVARAGRRCDPWRHNHAESGECRFNRVPIAAMRGGIAGLPLTPGLHYLSFGSMWELTQGVTAAIDEVERLNSLQQAAYEKCKAGFSWFNKVRRILPIQYSFEKEARSVFSR
jgi:hypothetical protein